MRFNISASPSQLCMKWQLQNESVLTIQKKNVEFFFNPACEVNIGKNKKQSKHQE